MERPTAVFQMYFQRDLSTKSQALSSSREKAEIFVANISKITNTININDEHNKKEKKYGF